jgi:hypothetical protein
VVSKAGRKGRREGRECEGMRFLTLIPPVVKLVELLGELSLLNGLCAGHRQGEPAFEVLHLVHDQQRLAVGS